MPEYKFVPVEGNSLEEVTKMLGAILNDPENWKTGWKLHGNPSLDVKMDSDGRVKKVHSILTLVRMNV